MDRLIVMKLRHHKQFHSLQEAFDEIKRATSNRIVLGNGISMRFDLKLRGFVAVSENQQGSQLICPVMGCESYTAGGHMCEHGIALIEHVKN